MTIRYFVLSVLAFLLAEVVLLLHSLRRLRKGR